MIKIKLDLENINSFVAEVTKLYSDATIYSGKYVINGKSIMGLYSLDLTKPIDLEIEDKTEDCSNFINRLKELNIIVE